MLARLQTLWDGEKPEVEESDNEEETDSGEGNLVTAVPRQHSDQVPFEIDPNIDITSMALLDMIAETEEAVEKDTASPCPSSMRPANLEKRISVAEAFENW